MNRLPNCIGCAAKKCVLNERPQINFIKDSQDFWYVRDVLNQQKKVQKEYVRYRAQQNQAVELFCTEQLKKAIDPFLPETAEPEKAGSSSAGKYRGGRGEALLFAQGTCRRICI